jgi:RecA/RadA recombinase
MSILDKVLKAVNNPYASIAKNGLICGDISGYIDTGIYVLNALISGKLLGGGFPKGKVVALAGEKGTGKTFILLNSLRNFLNSNLKAEVIFFESEGALTKELLIERGIDVSRVAIIPVSTVEELRNQSLLVLDMMEEEWLKTGEYPEVVMCLDSLGMLGTEFEQNTARTNDNKADMGKRAQLIKSVFRNITLKLSLLQIPMIITNHTYKGMGKYDPTKMGGGQGLEFAASIIIFLNKSAVREEKATGKGKDKIKHLIGNNITFTVHKGRMTIEGSRAILGLNFKTGISKYAGLLSLLVDGGILKKKGAWISYNDENIAQGDKQFYENVDKFITDDILNELEPFVKEKYCYGVVSAEGQENIKEEVLSDDG